MNRLIYILIIGISFFWGVTVNAQESYFDPFNIKPEYFQDPKIKDGLIIYDKQGNSYKVQNSPYVKVVSINKDGRWLKHGILYEYLSGYLYRKTTYRYDKQDGPHETYFKNGEINFQYTYKNGLKEGKWYQYRKSGILEEEKEYKNGVQEGEQIIYFENKNKRIVSTFVNGKKHGDSYQYDNKGKLIMITKYEYGKKISESK